ncbi:GGDEF domain-containing protein [Saccharopolyspora karakumensis]|uniref:GGDEF domain-containing protein n=1 Tax=Saccharopolyspora karakumensis TaxID=2530386 RepID=A0A4R5BLY6_9PSEU|nr:GGDEF domain-containing protein [Saccharopolyspora karakumensis]TDD87751.1 GGDEF domain-containing protein [Saccharopolyspora karakumensis]
MTVVNLAAVAVVIAAAVALVLSGVLGTAVSQLVADLTGVSAAVAAATTFAWTGWRRTGHERRWRWLMVLALACFAAAHALWTWYRSIDPMTFPNAANALYLGLPLFSFFALFALTKNDRGAVEEHEVIPSHVVVVLDGLIIAGSVMALSWKIAFSVFQHADAVRAGRLLVVASYTLADLVLITIVVLFGIALYGTLRYPLVWLVAGLGAVDVSDSVYLYTIANYSTPPLVADVGYMVGPVLLLLAAPSRNRQRSRPVPRTTLLFVPYVPFAVVCGWTLFTTISTGDPHVGEVYALIGVVALVVVRQLITLHQLYAARRQLTYQANHDPLTGASTRNVLLLRLDKAMSEDQQPRRLGLLYADLDHFKEVNDALGHEAGDTVLRTVAARVRARIRRTDTLARMGGDEFVILLDPAPENPQHFSERIQEAFDAPVRLNDSSCAVSASLGYVGLNNDGNPDEALARADEAMYRAKAAGRNGMRINP